MKLTKIELTEGIKLSEVEDKEQIYNIISDSYYSYLGLKCKLLLASDEYFVIRDNKVIPIIKDEYDNNKPYLIGKDENCIVGFIENDNNYHGYNTSTNDVAHHSDLSKLIQILNKEGFEVFKQE